LILEAIMQKLLLAIIAVGALCGAPAFAADMPLKAPPPAPMPVFDWSGFYIGGELGWQGSRIGLSSPSPFATLTYGPTHDSFAGGGFIGAQRQFGQFVLGIEGDYLAATGSGSLGATPSLSIFAPGGTGTAQARLRDLWSIGARAGMAMGMWMPYVTGGYANGAFEFDAQDVPPTIPGSEQAKSNNGGGYAGVGVDYAVTRNWIVGAEYRHYFFDSKTATGTATFPGFGGFTEPVSISPRTDTVMVRASYKFDWPMH
jgi:outer membrane immunogenic protein